LSCFLDELLPFPSPFHAGILATPGEGDQVGDSPALRCDQDSAPVSIEEIRIRGEMIRLGQLLKLAGVIETGAEVKDLLEHEAVLVNGEPETRRGRQLRHGDLVVAGGRELRVSA